MIVASNLGYRAGYTDVIATIDTTIKANTITAILGPNGAGKSTLLKCLSGSIRDHNGTVFFKDKNIHSYPLKTLAQMRSVLSQLNRISFPFTVREIVQMGRSPYGDGMRRSDNEIIDSVLEAVDANYLSDRIFPTLSGGEQQRVQLARALAQIWEQDDALLFLDEPTSALDIKHQHQILDLARKLVDKNGLTIVCVLHDLNLALHYTDNILLMKGGHLYKQGKTVETLSVKNIEDVFQVPSELINKFHLNRTINAL